MLGVPLDLNFSMLVPTVPCHMVHQLKVPPEVTGNDVRLGGQMQQTSVRSSAQIGRLF